MRCDYDNVGPIYYLGKFQTGWKTRKLKIFHTLHFIYLLDMFRRENSSHVFLIILFRTKIYKIYCIVGDKKIHISMVRELNYYDLAMSIRPSIHVFVPNSVSNVFKTQNKLFYVHLPRCIKVSNFVVCSLL